MQVNGWWMCVVVAGAVAACGSAGGDGLAAADAVVADVAAADGLGLDTGVGLDSGDVADAAVLGGGDSVQDMTAVADATAGAEVWGDAVGGGGDLVDAAGGADVGLDCAALLAALQAELGGLAAGHVTCAHDVDCTVVPTTTACQGTCGIAVNVAAAAAITQAVQKLDAQYCGATGFADQCGYSGPKCMAPAPACVDGVCVYKK